MADAERTARGTFAKGNRGGGRPAGSKNVRTEAVEVVARRLVDNRRYRIRLKKRLIAGELPPPIEVLLWHFAYGKPIERTEVTTHNVTPPRRVVFVLPTNSRGDEPTAPIDYPATARDADTTKPQ